MADLNRLASSTYQQLSDADREELLASQVEEEMSYRDSHQRARKIFSKIQSHVNHNYTAGFPSTLGAQVP